MWNRAASSVETADFLSDTYINRDTLLVVDGLTNSGVLGKESIVLSAHDENALKSIVGLNNNLGTSANATASTASTSATTTVTEASTASTATTVSTAATAETSTATVTEASAASTIAEASTATTVTTAASAKSSSSSRFKSHS
jgi:hypothetical protein